MAQKEWQKAADLKEYIRIIREKSEKLEFPLKGVNLTDLKVKTKNGSMPQEMEQKITSIVIPGMEKSKNHYDFSASAEYIKNELQKNFSKAW